VSEAPQGGGAPTAQSPAGEPVEGGLSCLEGMPVLKTSNALIAAEVQSFRRPRRMGWGRP